MLDPVTINLDGLNELLQFGPLGHLFGHIMAMLFLGVVTWRNIVRAGTCHGANCDLSGGICDAATQRANRLELMKGNAHVAKAIVSGLVAVLLGIMSSVMSFRLFNEGLLAARAISQ